MDRALDFGSSGWEFDPLQVHKIISRDLLGDYFYFFHLKKPLSLAVKRA
jgi:hypothetical protein